MCRGHTQKPNPSRSAQHADQLLLYTHEKKTENKQLKHTAILVT